MEKFNIYEKMKGRTRFYYGYVFANSLMGALIEWNINNPCLQLVTNDIIELNNISYVISFNNNIINFCEI